VKLKTASAKRLRGTLMAADDDAVTVAVNGSTLEVPVGEIVRGNLIDEDGVQ
jgi:ribosome maturation factor RimP